MGYGFKLWDMGEAQCQSCNRTFYHVYGSASHVCQCCGGILNCGMNDCVQLDIKRRKPKGLAPGLILIDTNRLGLSPAIKRLITHY